MSTLPPGHRIVTGHDHAKKAAVVADAWLDLNQTGTSYLTPVWATIELTGDNDARPMAHLFVTLAYADSAYNSPRVANATLIGIQIVRKFADQTGFVVHPRRCVVERTFA